MDMNQINQKITDFFKNLGPTIKNFPAKFKRMTLGEQIAYGCIVLGGLLVIVSLFLF
jgi:hypothetical protein